MSDPYKAGDRIEHTIFGKGTVEEYNGKKYGGSIVIFFDAHGTKELQLSFCAEKLTLLPSAAPDGA